jgi:D-arabinose 1-dehydrogenase-like Zn-dependent alcohol dehydrogenase
VSIEYTPGWSGRLARELGADYTVNAFTQDPVQAIKDLGGADAAIAVAVAPKAFEQAHRSLRRGGKLVLVALPADNAVQPADLRDRPQRNHDPRLKRGHPRGPR